MMLQAPGHRSSITSPANSGLLVQTFHSDDDDDDGENTDYDSSQSSLDDNAGYVERMI